MHRILVQRFLLDGSSIRAALLSGTALAACVAGSGPAAAQTAGSLNLGGQSQNLPQTGYFGGATYLNNTPYYGTTGVSNVTNDLTSAQVYYGTPAANNPAILTEFGAPAGTVYSGIIMDGTAGRTGLAQTSGSLTLAGTNTFTGGLTIQGGSITVIGAGTLGGSTDAVQLDGAGSSLVIANGQAIGALTVTNGTVAVGQGGSLTASNATVGSLGSVTVASGGTVTDDLTSAGTVVNGGTYNATVAQNTGTILNRSTGTWNGTVASNAGTIGNAGTWNGDVVSNSGSIGNAPTTGTWVGNVQSNTGLIANAGLWQGSITNSANGMLVTGGTITGRIDNGGTVLSYGGITFGETTAGGTIGGPVANAGSFTVAGPQTVQARMFDPSLEGEAQTNGITTVAGNFSNSGTLAVESGATFGVGGVLTNSGTVTNAGTTSATVAGNSGIIRNRSTGSWVGNVLSNSSQGLILNSGSWAGNVKTNAAIIGNSGVWRGQVVANAGTIGNLGVWAGGVTSNTGVIGNGGTWTGNISNSAGGTLVNFGTLQNGLTNSGTVYAYGKATLGSLSSTSQISGPIVNTNTGTFVVDGTPTTDLSRFGTVLAGLGITETVASVNGVVNTTGSFNNAGTIMVQQGGNLHIDGTLTNSGILNLAQGSRLNTLSATSYVGQSGSQAIIGVNLSPAGTSATAGQASQLNFGTASGLTTLAFQNVSAQQQVGYFPRIQVVNVTSGGTGAFVADPTSLAGLGNGVIGYGYSDGALIGSVKSSVAAAAGIQTTTVLTTLNSNFFQDWQPFEREAFLTAPQDPAPNTLEGGPWIRGKVGHESDDATSTADGVASRNRVSTDFTGFQVGGDVGRYNINGSGWNLIGGITGGEFFASSDEKLGGTTKGNFEIPYVGAYAALTKGPFFVDVLYHHDFYGLKLNDASAGLSDQHLSGNGDSFHIESAYNVALGNYGAFGNLSVSPTGSLVFSRVELDRLAFSALNLGTVRFDPIDSILGRAGLKFASSFVTEKLALQPFVIASVWHEFEGRTTSEFDSTTGFAVPMSVSRVGTFGQVGLGLNGELLGKNLLGTIRTDFRFGDRTSGESLTAQLRYNF